MKDPYFFGYGSLVNRRTHGYIEAHPARLRGWRRAWVATPRFGVVLLTGVPAPGHSIDGLIAAVPGADWAALDAREAGYARIAASHDIEHPLTHPADIAVYAVSPEDMLDRGAHCILLSYLDVVVQGFDDVFGEEGVESFFTTTDNWDTSIIDDRAAPVYPRHQTLTARQTDLVDGHLRRLGTELIPRDKVTLPPLY
jgi:hypothetical protein